ncbi:MAG: phytanoyl-CoA dioxygenase family protein, partial [Cyanobacteria bacterium P01_H01_bin.153]
MQTQVRRSLTANQIAQFHQDGFLAIAEVLPLTLIEQLIARFEPLFAGEFDTGIYPDEWHWNPYLGQPGASGQMTGVWKCDRTL